MPDNKSVSTLLTLLFTGGILGIAVIGNSIVGLLSDAFGFWFLIPTLCLSVGVFYKIESGDYR